MNKIPLDIMMEGFDRGCERIIGMDIGRGPSTMVICEKQKDGSLKILGDNLMKQATKNLLDEQG